MIYIEEVYTCGTDQCISNFTFSGVTAVNNFPDKNPTDFLESIVLGPNFRNKVLK